MATSGGSRSAVTSGSRTYFPSPEEESTAEQFSKVLDSLASASSERPALIGPHNEQIPIPREAFEVLVQVVEAMRKGQGIHVAPLNAQLTTQEAAEYLGISRPTVVKILESGALAYTQPGRHRYVRLEDLIEYAESVRVRRAGALDELARDAEEGGLYEKLDGPPPQTR